MSLHTSRRKGKYISNGEVEHFLPGWLDLPHVPALKMGLVVIVQVKGLRVLTSSEESACSRLESQQSPLAPASGQTSAGLFF